MALFIVFVSSLVILISFAAEKNKKTLLAALFMVFFFPIWVVSALVKKYK